MTKTSLYLIIILLFSCTHQNKSIETLDTLKTTTEPTSGTNAETEEEDCVFNNDYKGLTSEWLKELKIKDFIWRDDQKQALVPSGQDTVFFSKGGCTHSVLLVELKLTNDHHALTDSTYWVEKALALSALYHMNHYEQMIRERKIKMGNTGEKNIWYEIEDNDVEDNLIYNGIEITQDGLSKRINISQYVN